MMKTSLLLLSLALFSCQSVPQAEIRIVPVKPVTELALTSSGPDSLTITEASLPDRVRKGNPSLAAARKIIAEAQGQLQRSGVASNPELEIGFETTPRFHDFMLTVGISKKYPRTQKLLIERRVSTILVEAAQAEVRNAERLALADARQAFVRILAFRAQKSLLSTQAKNAQELSDFIKAAALRGEASPLEAGTAMLEATRFANRSKQIDIKEQLSLAQLKPLLGLEPKDTLQITDTLPEPFLPAMNVTAYQRPDLLAARLRARSANTEKSLVQARDQSDIEAGIYAGLGRAEDAPNGIEGEQILGLRFKIPLGTNPQTLGQMAATTARHERLHLAADALRKQISAEAHAAYAEMQQWQQLTVQITSELLPLAQKQIADTRAAYDRGEIPLQDVLRAREQKLSLDTAILEAKRDFHFARVNYLAATAQ